MAAGVVHGCGRSVSVRDSAAEAFGRASRFADVRAGAGARHGRADRRQQRGVIDRLRRRVTYGFGDSNRCEGDGGAAPANAGYRDGCPWFGRALANENRRCDPAYVLVMKARCVLGRCCVAGMITCTVLAMATAAYADPITVWPPNYGTDNVVRILVTSPSQELHRRPADVSDPHNST